MDDELTPPTAWEIYSICMESSLAAEYAQWLCKMAGVDYPPKQD